MFVSLKIGRRRNSKKMCSTIEFLTRKISFINLARNVENYEIMKGIVLREVFFFAYFNISVMHICSEFFGEKKVDYLLHLNVHYRAL